MKVVIKCFHCTVHQNKQQNTRRRCKLYSVPCVPRMRLKLRLTSSSSGAHYVQSLDLTFVDSDTTDGFGGTSGLRCLTPVLGRDP